MRCVTRRPFIIAVGMSIPAAVQAQDSAAAARVELAEAPFELPADVRDSVRFGWLVVPQNAGDPGAGTLRLAFAIIAPRTSNPRPDPIVLIPGGPGDAQVAPSTVGIARSPRVGLHRQHRAVIVLDPRGHGLSEPRTCPELNDAVPPVTPDAAGEAAFSARLTECRRRLVSEGVRLDLLSSAQTARDLDALRTALGVPQLNLIGASYGSHIAAVAARDVPHAIRAVMLHGPVPTGSARPGTGTAEVMQALLMRCAGQPECRRAYPSLDEDLQAVLRHAAHSTMILPLPAGGSARVDSAMIHEHLGELTFGRDLIAGAPALLHAVARNGPGSLEPLIPLLARRLAAPLQSYGTHLAFRCNDGTVDPRLMGRCHVWTGGDVEEMRGSSDVPALLFTGEFDTRTPPSRMSVAALSFSNAQSFVTPWYGHEGLPDCAFHMTDAFIIAPEQPLDATCLEAVTPVRFVAGVRSTPWLSRAVAAVARRKASVLLPAGIALLLCVGTLAALAVSLLRRTPSTADRRAADLAALLAAAAGAGFVASAASAAVVASRQSPLVLAIGLPAGFHWVEWLPWLLATAVAAAGILHVRARFRSEDPGWLRRGAIVGAAGLVLVCAALAASG